MVEYHNADDSRGVILLLLMMIAMGVLAIILIISLRKIKFIKNDPLKLLTGGAIWAVALAACIIGYHSVNTGPTIPKNAIIFNNKVSKDKFQPQQSYVDEKELLNYLKTRYGVDRVSGKDYKDPKTEITYKTCNVVYGKVIEQNSKKFINIDDFKCAKQVIEQ